MHGVVFYQIFFNRAFTFPFIYKRRATLPHVLCKAEVTHALVCCASHCDTLTCVLWGVEVTPVSSCRFFWVTGMRPRPW